MLVVLAISGGGTRAAALGYGVLEELRRTEMTVHGKTRRLLDDATYGDLAKAGGAFVIVNGSDITTGARFSYTQDYFDAICGDLSKVTLGRAVATSTALPPLLTPITLENRGGTCGRKAPAWQAAAEARPGEAETPGRALLRAGALQSYEDPKRPYIHLFDGGLSENLGLIEVPRAFELLKVDPDVTVLPSLRNARKVVVISVNALRFPEVDWDRSPAPPGKGTLADQMWSIPVDRISFDAVEQVHEKLVAWESEDPARRGYLAQVTFDSLKDPAERRYFRKVKTRLALPKEQVDKLREVGEGFSARRQPNGGCWRVRVLGVRAGALLLCLLDLPDIDGDSRHWLRVEPR